MREQPGRCPVHRWVVVISGLDPAIVLITREVKKTHTKQKNPSVLLHVYLSVIKNSFVFVLLNFIACYKEGLSDEKDLPVLIHPLHPSEERPATGPCKVALHCALVFFSRSAPLNGDLKMNKQSG